MNQAKLVALLGRPLTTVETTNFSLYLKIAYERLEDLLCMNLESTTEDRVFDVRNGYSTVFTDLFTDINSVSIDGNELTTNDYSVRQGNRRSGNWYNSIVLTNPTDCEVTINADWGLCAPDLQLLLAQLFALIGTMNTSNGNVKSKKVEDFSITFNDNTAYQQFTLDNAGTISKYSICGIQEIQHGGVNLHKGNWWMHDTDDVHGDFE